MAVKLKNVSFSYGDHPVLRDFSLTIPERGVICLFGPSGCGKTTVLRLLLGLIQPANGQVIPARLPVAVFQENRLLPWLSALDNVALVLHSKEALAHAAEALRAVGLPDETFAQRPDALSGGMQRRVAIARAWAAESDLLLLDEPFSGIDAENRNQIAALLRQYATTRPVVLITHLPEEAALMNAEVISMPTHE